MKRSLRSWLWRVPADGGQAPVRIEVAGLRSFDPAIAVATDRMAFSMGIDDMDIGICEAGFMVTSWLDNET